VNSYTNGDAKMCEIKFGKFNVVVNMAFRGFAQNGSSKLWNYQFLFFYQKPSGVSPITFLCSISYSLIFDL